MTGRTHDLAAITALTVVVLAQPPQAISLSTVILALVANQLGGIAPDIDQPTAPFWRNLPIGGVIGDAMTKLLGGHRFLTHSIIGVAGVGSLVHWLLVFLQPIMPHTDIGFVWWAFMIGMISHLVMDTLTKEGVPWLLPIPIKIGIPPIKAWRITTGKRVETFIVFPLLGVMLLFLVLHNYNNVITVLKNNIH